LGVVTCKGREVDAGNGLEEPRSLSVLLHRPAAGQGSDGRSWLLIKHKDEWSGELDIAEFAPKSVKSDGELEDILAADNPDIWISNRPAKGGETGAMFAEIIERAAKLKAGRAKKQPAPRTPRKTRKRST